MNFIKAIKDNKADEFTHWCFIRYGLGEYNKEPLEIIKTAKKVKFKAGLEYVNVFHGFLATIGGKDITLKGSVVTSKDIMAD